MRRLVLSWFWWGAKVFREYLASEGFGGLLSSVYEAAQLPSLGFPRTHRY